MHSQLLKPICLSPNRCETQITKNYQTSKQTFFYRSVISPFAVQLFLLPFSSHCSTQNVGFSDYGYVIKPPQPSSAIYGAPPFTAHRFNLQIIVKCWCLLAYVITKKFFSTLNEVQQPVVSVSKTAQLTNLTQSGLTNSNKKLVSILPPIFWRQQIGWSYYAASLMQFE